MTFTTRLTNFVVTLVCLALALLFAYMALDLRQVEMLGAAALMLLSWRMWLKDGDAR